MHFRLLDNDIYFGLLAAQCVRRTQRIRDTLDARTKAAEIYRKTGNLRAVQLLLGHTKVDSTVR
jgi:site-specific recombinase XerC